MIKKVALNAIHTHTGGGLIYLKNILPYLAQSRTLQWHLFLDKADEGIFDIPSNIYVHYENVPQGFIRKHIWEQFSFSKKLRKEKFSLTLCNANYIPYLAPNPVPIIHNNCDVEKYAQTKEQKRYWRILKKMTQVSIKRAPLVFSVAKHIIPMYITRAKDNTKVHIASPAVLTPRIDNITRENKLFLAIGDMYIQKDYEVLIKAFYEVQKIHADARLYIVGKAIDKNVSKSLKDYILEHKLERKVTLAGNVPHTQLLHLLQRATLYINTSLIECFNIPVLEALGCETPVIVYERDFQKEVAGDAAYYINFSEDPNQRIINVAEGICDILKQDDFRNILITAGKRRAKRFSWHKSAQTIMKQIALLLNK